MATDWDAKWKERGIEKPTGFAKRCYSHIKDKGFRDILDIGCGAGRDSIFFSEKGFEVTAIDHSEKALKMLQDHSGSKGLKVKTVYADIRNRYLEEKSYDIIYSHLGVHYFNDAETKVLFERLYNALRQGGYLFLKCKSVDDLLYGQGEKKEKDCFVKGHMRHFFSKDYMAELLAGFKEVKIRKTTSKYHSYKASFIEAVAIK